MRKTGWVAGIAASLSECPSSIICTKKRVLGVDLGLPGCGTVQVITDVSGNTQNGHTALLP